MHTQRHIHNCVQELFWTGNNVTFVRFCCSNDKRIYSSNVYTLQSCNCPLSFSRRSWMALNGVATASAAAESTARWSQPQLKMTRSCAASCAVCRPTCCAYGDAKSNLMPRSCGSSGGARSPISPTSFIASWKVSKRKKNGRTGMTDEALSISNPYHPIGLNLSLQCALKVWRGCIVW